VVCEEKVYIEAMIRRIMPQIVSDRNKCELLPTPSHAFGRACGSPVVSSIATQFLDKMKCLIQGFCL